MLTLDLAAGTLSDGERSARLTPIQTRFLAALARRQGRATTINAIMQEIYDNPARQPDEGTLGVVVCHLRKRMRAAGLPNVIETIRGRGFRSIDVILAGAAPLLFTKQQREILAELIETHPNTRLAERVYSAMAV